MLKARGTPLVLGLRDVMDEPELLLPEWERKKVLPALQDLYDEIWVYGVQEVCAPYDGLDMPAAIRLKTRSTGYLRRHARSEEHTSELQSLMRISYAVFCLKK